MLGSGRGERGYAIVPVSTSSTSARTNAKKGLEPIASVTQGGGCVRTASQIMFLLLNETNEKCQSSVFREGGYGPGSFHLGFRCVLIKIYLGKLVKLCPERFAVMDYTSFRGTRS